MDTSDFQRVLAEGRGLQARLADLFPVVVGGTAAALHCGHREPQTWASAFAEACEGEVLDAAKVPLATYKGLREPFTKWAFVANECQKLGRALLKLELEGGLPSALPLDWPNSAGV